MLVIGTRGSDLALTQAHWVRTQLGARGIAARLEVIKTKGDRIDDVPLAQIGGKGFFTQEIEDALRSKGIDLAVHSLKDLPTESPQGLTLVAIPAREDPRDCLLIHKRFHDPDAPLWPLQKGTVVGTSAIRRKAQLTARRADLQLEDLRGNVPTRVRRLREGRCGAIVLARAGLDRLQLDVSDLVVCPLSVETFVPAPAQGALGLQMRCGDGQAQRDVGALHDTAVARAVNLERALLARLEGGCHVPLGAYVENRGQTLHLRGFYQNGTLPRWTEVRGSDGDAMVDKAFAALVG